MGLLCHLQPQVLPGWERGLRLGLGNPARLPAQEIEHVSAADLMLAT